MSTRAVYSVFEGDNTPPINIYIHHDGYPSGALDHIKEAFPFAWKLPRFEADEFAAALCAGAKSSCLLRYTKALENQIAGKTPDEWYTPAKLKQYFEESAGGGCRVFPSGPPIEVPAFDLEYRYEIRFLLDTLYIKCFSTHYCDDDAREEEELFSGTFKKFETWAKNKY